MLQETVETILDGDFTDLQSAATRFDWGALLRVILVAAVILAATVIAAKVVARILLKIEKKMMEAKNPRTAAVSFGRYLAVGLIYFAGIAAAVSSIPPLKAGLNALLTAGGVLAVVAGLASQQALGNLVSGLMILAFRPFVLGDVIRYVDRDISGTVEEITLQYTTIRTGENKRVLVPNSAMNSAVIENADYGDHKVCWYLEIGITYETDLPAAKQIMMREIMEHPDFLDVRTPAEKQADSPAVLVRVKELGASAVVLRAGVWAQNNGKAIAMKSDLYEAVKAAYENAGIDIAYPHVVIVNK